MNQSHHDIAEKPKKIRLMVIDDSLLFRELIVKGYKDDDSIDVVGSAADPFEAKESIPKLAPDVLMLDVEMPKMDGIKFLRRLMRQYPLPVIVVSSLAPTVFEALEAGALDFVHKSQSLNIRGEGVGEFLNELKQKIVSVAATGAVLNRSKNTIFLFPDEPKSPPDPMRIIAIGASTGGTEAIMSILSKFSENMPGIVVAQHMPEGFTDLFAKRLDSKCELDVREAVNGDSVRPGLVLLAPGGMQTRVVRGERGYTVMCRKEPDVAGAFTPSVDVLFKSVAEAAGGNAVGVILSGMGSDGAKGLLRIREAGGYTIGQDEASSVVYGMPMKAAQLGSVREQLPLYRIADGILRAL